MLALRTLSIGLLPTGSMVLLYGGGSFAERFLVVCLSHRHWGGDETLMHGFDVHTSCFALAAVV